MKIDTTLRNLSLALLLCALPLAAKADDMMPPNHSISGSMMMTNAPDMAMASNSMTAGSVARMDGRMSSGMSTNMSQTMSSNMMTMSGTPQMEMTSNSMNSMSRSQMNNMGTNTMNNMNSMAPPQPGNMAPNNMAGTNQP